MSQLSTPHTLVSQAWFRLRSWTQIEIVGPDRKKYLNSFSTNDITLLETGTGCEAFIPEIKGRILGHVFMLVAEESLKLFAVPDANQSLVPHLRKYLLGVDAEILDRTEELELLCLCGTELSKWTSDLLKLGTIPEPLHGRDWESPAGNATAFAVPLTNLPTLLVSGNPNVIGALCEMLSASEIPEGEAELLECLRIEAGVPWHGRDITAQNIAQEAARTAQAISFKKGCYLGQEPIARLDAMGHTNKELRGLVIAAPQVSVGSAVLAGEREVGTVTSSAFSVPLQKVVALGILRTSSAAPGTELSVQTESGPASAVVFWPRL